MVNHYMKYVVRLDPPAVTEDTTGWLQEFFGPRFTRWDFDPECYQSYRFKIKEDAAAFKLRWT